MNVLLKGEHGLVLVSVVADEGLYNVSTTHFYPSGSLRLGREVVQGGAGLPLDEAWKRVRTLVRMRRKRGYVEVEMSEAVGDVDRWVVVDVDQSVPTADTMAEMRRALRERVVVFKNLVEIDHRFNYETEYLASESDPGSYLVIDRFGETAILDHWRFVSVEKSDWCVEVEGRMKEWESVTPVLPASGERRSLELLERQWCVVVQDSGRRRQVHGPAQVDLEDWERFWFDDQGKCWWSV